MRFAELSVLFLLILIQLAEGFEVTVVLKNYDGFADLRIANSSAIFFEGKVLSGQIISLPSGKYTFELSAMGKVFLRNIEILRNETLEFNLGFTNSTDFLSVVVHSVVFHDRSVEEIIIVSNKADLNFEGDLSIPLPNFDGLKVLYSNLDFLEAYVHGKNVVFKSLLVNDNDSGSIRIAYYLTEDVMERDMGEKKIIIAPLVEVEDFKGLNKTFREMGGEKIAILEGSGNFYVKFRFEKQFPFSLLSIPIISFAIFLIFFSKRGGWRLDENRGH